MGLIIDQPQPITDRLYLDRNSRRVRLWNSSRYCRYSRKLVPGVAVVVTVRCRDRRPFPFPLVEGPFADGHLHPVGGRAVTLGLRRPCVE